MKEKEKIEQVIRERDELGFWKMDKKTRLDMPMPDYSNLPYLSDEEKALGTQLMQQYAPTPEYGIGDMPPILKNLWLQQPAFLLSCDPEYYQAYAQYYDVLVKLVTGFDSLEQMYPACVRIKGIDTTTKRDDPEVRRRFSNALLMGAAIGVEFDDQWYIRFYSNLPLDQRFQNDDAQDYLMPAEKFSMLHHPESSVWDDEERLCLQFTYAVIRRKMTDEIWDRAMAAWGEKETFRYLQWIGLYNSLSLFQNALDLRCGQW
ncbi:MAG: hypothetical protein HKP58_10385 [Desulfatitalea sp.]|nr:hypothetical protein [Desulfatitalea sp.]NNK00808.1 hypothetical protein [Desulfatitalea sp.]